MSEAGELCESNIRATNPYGVHCQTRKLQTQENEDLFEICSNLESTSQLSAIHENVTELGGITADHDALRIIYLNSIHFT